MAREIQLPNSIGPRQPAYLSLYIIVSHLKVHHLAEFPKLTRQDACKGVVRDAKVSQLRHFGPFHRNARPLLEVAV